MADSAKEEAKNQYGQIKKGTNERIEQASANANTAYHSAHDAKVKGYYEGARKSSEEKYDAAKFKMGENPASDL